MDIKILDQTGRQLTAEQLNQLNIWNTTISHICASVLERLLQAKVSTPGSVAEASPP